MVVEHELLIKGLQKLEDVFGILRTYLRAWLNILCQGENDVNAERRKSGDGCIYTGLFKTIVGVLTLVIHNTLEIGVYIVAPMDQEILKVFVIDVRCAVVMHFSAWSAVD
jgi:hypothetical protein